MFHRFRIITIAGSLALAGLGLKTTLSSPSAPTIPATRLQQNLPPPSEAEIHERTQKLISAQHKDDMLLEQYERIERHVSRTGGANPQVLEDKTYRVVPTGSGTLKILLKNGDKPVNPAEYRKQLLAWRNVLEIMLNPDDPRAKAALAKSEKRKRDRAELVDAARDAFLSVWLGRERVNGRLVDIVELHPNPNFHSRSTLEEAMTHITAKIWVDLDTNQLARGEAHVTRDISFGGGILGKLYRGGVFSMDQAELAPDVWLPTRYQYDFMGRKFLFMFEEHQYIEVSHYRLVGTPRQALALVQSELESGRVFTGDP